MSQENEGVGWTLAFEEFAESFKLKGTSGNLCSKLPTRAKQNMLFRALESMPCFSLHFLQLLAFHSNDPNWKCVFIAVLFNQSNTSCPLKFLVWGFEWQLLILQVRKHAVIRGSHFTAFTEWFHLDLYYQIPSDFTGKHHFHCIGGNRGTDSVGERKSHRRILK